MPFGRRFQFKFSITHRDRAYDVYRFRKDGKLGTLAFTRNADGRFEISVFCQGDLTEQEVCDKLECDHEQDATTWPN